MTAAFTRTPVGALPAHGTTARRHRGCDCTPCRRAQRRYDKRARTYRARGIAGRVPTAAATEHVRKLRASGATLQAIADAADCSQGTIINIERGTRPRLLASIARRVLAVREGALAPSMVAGVGASRRVQALYAASHPLAVLSVEFGMSRTFVSELANGRRERVTYATHRRISDVYDRLSGVSGPSEYTRQWAMRRGWLPPVAWDGLDIDDPAVTSDAGERTPRPLVVAEETEFLTGMGVARHVIAAQVGLSVDSLEKTLARARQLVLVGDREGVAS